MSSGTCSRAIGGWLGACAAATGVIIAFVWIIVALASVSSGDLDRFVGGTVTLVFPGLLVLLITCVLTSIPAVVVVWVSERFAIRSIWFFGCAGAVIGVLSAAVLVASFKRSPEPAISFSPLFAVAGFAAGWMYWRLAGRHAGGS